ncbi:Helix-turn-helix domain-containing protein [Salinibacillus kushneri]|uniref:Helix-turn-helix domain-containing protein n=2 Tax=Salinibacillus kushneri TaxID=237682 RepID=A0A1H9ZE00_9BACI|nr:Helix-turn-helix domain-containing protein [Salinibacillus kushneri]
MTDQELKLVIGRFLHRKRIEMEKEINDYSIEEIAYQAWIHDKSLGRMKRGETMPYVFNLIHLSKTLHISWEFLDYLERNDNITKGLGRYLRMKRYDTGRTKRNIAQLARLNENYLSDIERGKKMPSLKALIKLSYHLHIPWELLDEIKKNMN